MHKLFFPVDISQAFVLKPATINRGDTTIKMPAEELIQ